MTKRLESLAVSRVISKSDRAEKAGKKLFRRAVDYVYDNFYDAERVETWPNKIELYAERVHSVNDALGYANMLFKTLRDPHTKLLPPAEKQRAQLREENSFVGIGVDLDWRRGRYIVAGVTRGSPAEKAGLRRNDILLEVGGEPVTDLSMEELRPMIRGVVDSQISLQVARGKSNRKIDFSFIRKRVIKRCIESLVLPNNVGYLRVDNFEQNNLVAAMRRSLLGKLAGCAALVIDLRGNGGGSDTLVFGALGLFLETGKLASIVQRIPGTQVDLAVVHELEPRRLASYVTGHENFVCRTTSQRRACVVKGSVPIVVLMDGDSASCSELFAGALRDNGRAVIVGEKSYGKGVGQTHTNLPGGTLLATTQFSYKTPKGHWPGDAHRQRFGLKPNLTVRSKARILQSSYARDRQLQAACKLIARKLAA